MAAYFIAAYDVADPEEFAKYNPGSLGVIMKTMKKHGGRPISAGGDSEWFAGQRQVVIVLEFPDAASAHAWESDPDYAEAKAIRLRSTTNRIEFIAPQFVPPS